MRILAFSDIHRDVDRARQIVSASADADVVIGAGDFAICGEGSLDTLHVLRDCRCDVIIVHGNHDNACEMADFCADWNLGHFLHGTAVEIDGLCFAGLGGEVPSRTDHVWNASESEERAAAMLAALPRASVIVTHTPPLGHADLQHDGTHEGSAAIRDYIRQQNPRLALCGHIHNAWGMTGTIGDTRVHNLGPKLNWFEI
ncbi:metallophosphoesterase family protein [Erythrobacter mangrovi]|uniref:Metallophosphoesterase family protein n=1 Tax=Erythrobacter mangrovi TaxID=2739433 RepID=A0A7D3XCB1_9SPHN|nr:metallophosphoesterase family protein [Erythrobacter mangrovi]QKG71740.1 metallophosphoesterase family protein [Erythrobacter mangrovi]